MICKHIVRTAGTILVMLTSVLFLVTCESHIIQRSASDYFFYEEGNWWRYAANDTDTVYVEVEPPDTLIGIECYPVSFPDFAWFFTSDNKSLSRYVKTEYYFGGNNYTVMENYVVHIELPLVNGNIWKDSLFDSILVAGQTIGASYVVSGRVTDCIYDEDYDGDIYTLEIDCSQTIITPDTTIKLNSNRQELYAPGIGLVEFCDNNTDRYILVEYEVE